MKVKITFEIERDDLLETLKERGIQPTEKHIRQLKKYLQTTARDAANTALVDYQEGGK